ncbi:hypothetical protein PhCBS80983_g06136 [Powellomyces hirtus]|uniref:U1 small nuclear ribonucleoprotein 70 kDa n=1 Tax=Powellomyces hirtus TaxID=109895 RepID=A0A507DQE0_9FUNG|nr:hypothetical protein PhCBS80983_g06136 [Powellomyces hirtus]
MTAQLPPNLLKLFAPRPPLPYLQPLDSDHAKRRGATISGIGAFLERCVGHDTDYVPTESIAEKKKRKKAEREEKAKEAVEKGKEIWDPSKDPHVSSDPYKTLFVSRLSYETTEKELKREFEKFGPIKTLRIVTDPATDKSRGYAFVEYEREKDMKAAYKEGDGLKLNDRRVLVDVERGRTVKGWKPRRLGGGLGGTRLGGNDVNQRWSGREGGYAGGGGGGFHGGYNGSYGGGGYGSGAPVDGGYRSGPPRGSYDRRSYGSGGGGSDRGPERSSSRYGSGPPRGYGGGGYGDRSDRHERSDRSDRGPSIKMDRDSGSIKTERDYGSTKLERDHGKPDRDLDAPSYRSSSRGDPMDTHRSSRDRGDREDRHGDRRSSRSDRKERRSRSPRRERDRSSDKRR